MPSSETVNVGGPERGSAISSEIVPSPFAAPPSGSAARRAVMASVLQQLAEENLGPVVKVVAEQVDDPAQVDLKTMIVRHSRLPQAKNEGIAGNAKAVVYRRDRACRNRRPQNRRAAIIER